MTAAPGFKFICLPSDATNITQRFGENPQDYEPYGLPYHLGIDFGLWENDPVYAVAGGSVTLADRDPNNKTGFGIYCIIQHDKYFRTIYAHLNYLIIQAGQEVEACQHIGGAGSTGRSSGPHLHLQLEKNGHAVDPMPFLKPLLNGSADIPTPPGYLFGFVYVPGTIPTEGSAGEYGLNLRAQPSKDSAKLGYIPPGTKFQIISAHHSTYYPIYVAQQLVDKKPQTAEDL